MGNNVLTVFLPCRLGSQRVENKNVRPFAGIKNGLIEIKLSQLINSKVDNIIVSSNDDRVLTYADSLRHPKILLDERPDELGSSKTSTDQVINYVPTIINEGHVMWTHVTSPFMEKSDYDLICDKYFESIKLGYDSLMTVKKLHAFLWNKNGPINYDRSQEKWPRTQTLEPLYEVDSGAFVAPIECYRDSKDRIGSKPFLLEQDDLKTIDIDWPEDFEFAEKIWLANL